MNRALKLGVGVLAAGLFIGCNNGNDQSNPNPANTGAAKPNPNNLDAPVTDSTRTHALSVAAADIGKEAVAQIHGAGDTHDKIHGTAHFSQADNGVKIVVDVEGLTPGKHGIHIHEKPDLSDPKLLSTGGHFNPADADHKHAGPTDPKRHAGDLGNIEVDQNGHGHLELTDDALAIEGKNGVVGHAIIIHANEDDLKTQQPPGNSGARVAGGAIVLATDGQKSGT